MKFTLTGHTLTVEAETPQEGVEICEHFRLPVADHALNLASVAHVSGSEKRPWHAVTARASSMWLKPYYDLLERITGCAGPFDIEHPDLRYSRRMNLCHTHLVTRARIDGEGLHAEGFIQAEDWNGQTGAQRAVINFEEYVIKELGTEQAQREFIPIGDGGLYKRNPNYGRGRSKVSPAVTHRPLFELLVQHWLAHYATPEQRDIWQRGEECYRAVCKATLAERFMHSPWDDRIHLKNYTESILLDDFKRLGAKGQ